MDFGSEGVGLDKANRLYWRKRLGFPKERRYVRVAGVSPDIQLLPFTDSLDNLRRAVEERVFQVKGSDGLITPPRPAPADFAKTLYSSRKALLPLLPSTAPVSHQTFVDSYSGRKRMRYQEALDKIKQGRFCLKEDAKVKVFLKYEKTDRTSKADPVPRVISPRDPKFNLRLGRYLKHLEKPLFKAIDEMFGERTIMKGLNAEQSATILHDKWQSFVKPIAVGLDASRFDQHVSKDALKWEHSIYLQCFKENKHKQRLRELLQHQLVNHCFGETQDGELEYIVQGTRMSGDMNTSMGNCLLMCCMIYAYLQDIGVNAKLANNGDDCVLFLEHRDLHRLNGLYDWFLKLGFNMAIEKPVDEFEGVEFCQTKPVFDGSVWIMSRKPLALAKDAVMLHPWDYNSNDYYKGWLNSVGTGGLRLAGQLPIFQDYYALFQRSGKVTKHDFSRLQGFNAIEALQSMKRDYGVVTPQCRSSFYYAFGVTPDEQLVLEKFYKRGKLVDRLGDWEPRSVMGSVF